MIVGGDQGKVPTGKCRAFFVKRLFHAVEVSSRFCLETSTCLETSHNRERVRDLDGVGRVRSSAQPSAGQAGIPLQSDFSGAGPRPPAGGVLQAGPGPVPAPAFDAWARPGVSIAPFPSHILMSNISMRCTKCKNALHLVHWA